MNTDVRLTLVYKKLYKSFGPQQWWPGESGLECAVGAILTQNTSWINVEKAILNLKSAMDITIKNLEAVSTEELSALIRPAGFYIQKTWCIKRLIKFIINEYGGKIDNMKSTDTYTLRQQLLSIKGIGPETADCILLYVLKKPVFVIDRYTYRMLFRHGFVDRETTYNEMQKLFMDNIENDEVMFGEFHALIVQAGKKHCKKKADCEACPLNFDSHDFSNEVI